MSSVNGAVSGRLQLQASGLPWSVSTAVPPWSLCVWTFLCLEKSKGGIENVLVVTDHFSRYAQAYLTKYQKACTVAKVLWRNFFCRFGFPQKLHADQGTNFESAIVKELCKCTGITKTHTTPYHPQGNGTTERANRTLMNTLGTMEPHLKPRWHEHSGETTGVARGGSCHPPKNACHPTCHPGC